MLDFSLSAVGSKRLGCQQDWSFSYSFNFTAPTVQSHLLGPRGCVRGPKSFQPPSLAYSCSSFSLFSLRFIALRAALPSNVSFSFTCGKAPSPRRSDLSAAVAGSRR